MKRQMGAALIVAAGFGLGQADAAQSDVDGHVATARTAAGLDHPGTLTRLCVPNANDAAAGLRAAAASTAPPPPRVVPDRAVWYAEPRQVFDNLYFLGTKVHNSWALKTSQGLIIIDTLYNYASEAEIVDGLTKLGLNPATIKYVIISHGHGDHDEGAKLLQDRYGARIVMGGADWDMIEKAPPMPGGTPKRDIVASDGQKITLGDTTVTIVTTPGHTLGTLSMLFDVKEKGKTYTVAYVGGTAFNFPRDAARFDTYAASSKKFAKAAADAKASLIISNHSEFDLAYLKSRAVASGGASDTNPFLQNADTVARYFTVTSECAEAEKQRLLNR